VILADTGPLVAALNPRDPAHTACRRFLQSNQDVVVIPSLVIAEVTYFLGHLNGAAAEARFLRTLAGRALAVEDPMLTDYERAADLVEQYGDFPIGTIDAVIVAMAERLSVTTILTLDHRHFRAIRPEHRDAFTLLP